MSQQEDRWICRKRIEEDKVCKDQVCRNKVFAELVFGHWEQETEHRNGQRTPARIVGEVYHTLSGPTAEASIASYAEDLNFRHVPPSKAPSFKPASSKKQDPNQFSLPLVGNDLNLRKPTK